jgi:hypothetical protein
MLRRIEATRTAAGAAWPYGSALTAAQVNENISQVL